MPSSFHPNEAGYRSMPPSGSKMDQALGSSCESRTKELAYRNETCRESSTAFIPKIRLKQVPVWVCLIANSSPKPTAGVSRRKTANTEASPYRCCCRCKPGKPRDSMPLRLLIADDERLFRQSLRTLLETARDIAVVAEAADGQEAVVKAKQTQPDMALLDLALKVLHLLAEGLNNEEISRLTHVARETVKGQLKGLSRKLQVKNRTEAAVLAVREGID